MNNKLSLLSLMITAVFAGGCTLFQAASPTPIAQVEESLAQVTSIQILQETGTPDQVKVVVKGQLPDGCTSIDQVTTQRDNNTFAVTIQTRRAAQENCTGGPQTFQREVPVDLSGLPAGTYIVSVNGVTDIFQYKAATDEPTATPSPSPTLGQTSLAASPTPAPTSPASTATPTTEPTQVGGPTPTTQPTPETPAPTPTTQPTQVAATTTPGEAQGCTDLASFDTDVTVPDDTVYQPQEKFVKTWRIYNAGTCTWGPGYELVFAYGDQMSAPLSTPVPQAAPGSSVEVSVGMVAPSTAGQHASNWLLQNAAGQRFGFGQTGQGTIWTQIVVSYYGAQTASVASTGASTGSSGSTGSSASAGTTTTQAGCTYTTNPDFVSQVLAQINAVRSSYNLNELTLQNQLSAAAMWYSVDMACNNRVDPYHHTDSQGGRWYDRIQTQGYSYSSAYENVYFGNPDYGGTPQGAMNYWMNSQIHRENILRPDVTQIGIGYAYTTTSDYRGYFTVDFASP